MIFLSRGLHLKLGFLQSIGGIIRSSSLLRNSSNMKFVWMDMEMTGLNVQQDKVLEVACLLTDGNLTGIIEGPHIVIHQPESTLASMIPWCVEQHTKTGLVEECKRSKITENDAEMLLFDFIMKNIPQHVGVLAGNSVHVDKKFLEKYFPKVNDYLHYRIMDVSSIKEICRCWYPDEYSKAPQKSNKHRALDDIKQSIQELQYYKNSIFKPIDYNNILSKLV